MMSEPNPVYVVDDEEAVRESMVVLLEAHALSVGCFASAEEFLTAASSLKPGCVLADVRMPGMGGIELVEKLRMSNLKFPVVVMTGDGEIPVAVHALNAGAVDFIEKPFAGTVLIDAVSAALQSISDASLADAEAKRIYERLGLLTTTERGVMAALVDGKQNKEIAESLGIGPGMVEVHRARLMEKMNARSLSALVRMAVVAGFKL